MNRFFSILKETFNTYNVFLILIVTFHVVLNIVWHLVNNAPPTWDSAGHLGLSFLFADKIKDLVFGEITFGDFLRISNYYPPLVQLIGGIFILAFGRLYFSAIFIGTFFFAVSIIYLYKIVNHYFHDAKLASFVVFIYSMFPHVWEQSRMFHLDVPLVALLLVSYYYLIRSNSMKSRKMTLTFFVFFTLVQLTKWYGFVYLVVPFFYEVLFKSLRDKDLFNRYRISNILLGSMIVLVFAVPWYVANRTNITNIAAITSKGEAGDPTNVLSFDSIFYYIKTIMTHQITFVSTLLLLISFVFFYIKKVHFRNYLLAITLFPYLIFTLIQNKDLRYVLPLTPIFAFYIGYTLEKLSIQWLRGFKTLYTLFLMFIFFFMSFNKFNVLPNNLKFIAYMIGGPYYQGWFYEPYTYAADDRYWRNDEILKDVQQLSTQEEITAKGQYKMLELSDNKFYSLASFEMYRRQMNFSRMEIVVPYFQFVPFTAEQLSSYLTDIHFALVPQNPGPSGLRNIEVLDQLKDYFLNNKTHDFMLVKTYDMPDGNVLSLFKRQNYTTYQSANVREDSLKVSVGNILFLDRKNTGGLPIKILLYNDKNEESIVEIVGGGEQRRIQLDGFVRFRIDLPLDQIDVRELRGWLYDKGEFTIDSNYTNVIKESGDEYVYDNLKIVPRSQYVTTDFKPKSIVRYTDHNTVVVSVEHPDADQAFVAYATSGWEWHNIWLGKDYPDQFIEIPTAGLLQLEVSQLNQNLVGFPSTWGFFPCYEGKAVCYYPPVEGL